MSAAVSARSVAASIEHAPIACVDLLLAKANAENMLRYTLDDLTEARTKIGDLSRKLEAAHEENRRRQIKTNEVAKRVGVARELLSEGRTSLAMALLADIEAMVTA